MESLAESLGWLFGWLLRNSAHATLLALLLWLLERTVLRSLPPRWRYGLWLLVIVRLLLPVAPGSSLSLSQLVDLAPDPVASAARQVLGLPVPVATPASEAPASLADTPAWFLAAIGLWLPGAILLSSLLWRDQRRIRRALAVTVPVAEGPVLDLLRQSRGVMRVRWPVQLVESPLIGSPAIAGWLRPRILLPSGLLPRLSPDEARFLFLHELAHVKRADIALNWLLAAVQILHWFNPVVWIALRRLLAVREEVCDELVLRRSFPGASREYGLTLLRLLEECAPRRIVPALAGVLDDVRSLRQRMRCIRNFGVEEERPWMPALVTVSLAVVGLTERPHEALENALTPPAPAPRAARSLPARTPPPLAVASPSEPETASRRRSATARVLDVLSAALHEAASGAHDPEAPSPTSPEPNPSFTSGGRGSPAVALASGGGSPHVAPVRAPGSVRAATTAASPPSSVTRLYPLPPIGQRGDILRPPVGSGPAEAPGRRPGG